MERTKKSLIYVVAMSIVMLISPHYSNAEPAGGQIKQVALFKNGLGFFVSEVECPQDKISFSFVPAGAASHGTFWVAYPKQVKLENLTAKEVDSEETTEAVTIAEILKANVGRNVKLLFKDSELSGTITYFAENRKEPVPTPYSPGAGTAVTRRTSHSRKSNLLIIKSDNREICINPQNVTKVEFPDEQAKKTITTKSRAMQLDVKLSEPAPAQRLSVSYLAKGITWAPSYIIDITEPDKAGLSAKAVIINEVCDLEDVTIQLVTGFPHLQFADVVSPLAVKENLAKFLQSLTKGQSERGDISVMSNVMMQNVEYSHGRGRREAAMPEYGTAQSGMTAEDLFFYPVEKVNLAKGHLGYFPLFTERVPYKHIYKWEIPDYVNEDDYYGRRQQKQKEQEEVWHCIRLENTTKVPWTTAPAEIVKKGFILGQDILTYVPTNGENTVRITRAVNVKAEQLELETNRQRDAARLYGHHYDLVTVEGKLSATNFQDKAITLEISKILSGEIKSSQPEAEIESLARGLRRMNAVRKLTWTIELKPQENKQIKYTYEVYVRR